MKDSFRKLAEEAGFVFWEPSEFPARPIDWASDYDLEFDRYSEMIVKKCIEICKANQFQGADHFNNGSLSSAELISDFFKVDPKCD